jgi:hypothetical protein
MDYGDAGRMQMNVDIAYKTVTSPTLSGKHNSGKTLRSKVAVLPADTTRNFQQAWLTNSSESSTRMITWSSDYILRP